MPAAPESPQRSGVSIIVVVGLLLVVVAALAAVGTDSPGLNAISVFEWLLRAGWPAAVYLAAGAGLGELFRKVSSSCPVRLGLGLTLQLSLSHSLGICGAWAGQWSTAIAWLPIAVGLVLATNALTRWRRSAAINASPKVDRTWLLCIPPTALLLVAACNPPGYLWDSEFGGFDALSYHLQLPQEWLASGRIAPLQHNVYSFLPGYMESAFTHLGAMTAAAGMSQTPPQATPLSIAAHGLAGGDGWRLISCQLLHAGFTLVAAGLVASLAHRLSNAHKAAAPLVAAAFLATPWTTVVGSLAYNEMAMTALFAAALLAAFDDDSPNLRWILAGALVGGACCVKPTALFLCGGPVGIVLLTNTAPRRWIRCGVFASLAGAIVLSPWLIRNYTACGNPVFPFAASVFPNASGGTGHWTADQVSRYSQAHHFQGSLSQRLALLFVPDPTDPAGTRMRGLLHPQWFALFPVGAALLAWSLVKSETRRHASLWAVIIAAQLCCWLVLTHIQSRFLIPLLLPVCALIALSLRHTRRVAPWAGAALALLQTAAGVMIFLGQHPAKRDDVIGAPNQFLALGPSFRNGELFRAQLAAATPAERESWLAEASPEHYCNLALPADATLGLVGNTTPLYFTRPITYNTTWDHWPISDSLGGGPAPGVTHLLVDFSELSRFQRSAYIDPGLTQEALTQWLKSHTDVVSTWPQIGVLLVKVRGVGAPTMSLSHALLQ
ncbi:MAG: hypothetical protein JSR77_06810 [Planctomycetes bacterium]|nr:hypothetical protein [Planctomycetota bacterium]